MRAFEILINSHDNREKLQAMALFKNPHLVKLGCCQMPLQ